MTTENDSGAPDVIIVGGGVIGCAIAYHLAADHHVRSLIIERNGIGSEASGGAAGELVAGELAKHSDHAPIDVFTRFLQAGVALHANTAPALLEESGTDYLLADLPLLRPAFTDAEAEALHDEVTELNDAGIAAEWVERETILSMRTWIADDVVGAIYSTEQQVESYPFALALAQACEQHGVEIRTGDVTGIERSGSRVTGVRMGPETLSAQIVIIANGPWAQHTSEWIGLDALAYPCRRHGLMGTAKLEVVPVTVDSLPSLRTLQEEIDRAFQDGHLRGKSGAFELVRILPEQGLMRLGSIELGQKEWSRDLFDRRRRRVDETHAERRQQA